MEKIVKELDNVLVEWKKLQPLSDSVRDKVRKKFSLDFNYNSNHIEGNTLTYGQTEVLLLFGKTIGEARIQDMEEMKASNVGLRMMEDEAVNRDMPLTENFIRTLHKTLLREDYTVYKNLPGGMQTSYTIHAGRYKTRPNSVITRYGDRFEYASPEETPALMNDLVTWYNEEEAKGRLTPIELAILFHYRYIRIHPFEDGNGRIARLMVNYILLRHNLPMVVVRSRKKQDYLEALHKADLNVGMAPSDGAHAELKQIKPFYTYFVKLITDEIGTDIKYVTTHDENVWWFDGEMITFRSQHQSRILRELWGNPSMKESELVEMLGINRSAVQKHIQNLIDKGYIMKTLSGWYVTITASL
ncbi:MAG: Fic family protein [Prevotella sp.]|nr:Fic family protein [Prevotella sp.]MBQ9237672.1 Fic family protein [Prevotella sp.]